MRELKCPQCGSVFTVDEEDYASIVSQIRTSEFEAEIERRISEIDLRHKTEQLLLSARAEQEFQKRLSQKDLELESKEAEVIRIKGERETALAQLRSEMETEIVRMKGENDALITQLRSNLDGIEEKKDVEKTLALAEKDRLIATLNSTIEQHDSKLQIALLQEQNRSRQLIQEKESEIVQLKSQAELERNRAQIRETELIKHHETELRAKQDLVDYYKDLKTRMSTKMVGETLEMHCSTLFNQLLRPMLPNAYFEKDNEVADGSKGDFIFRDYEDGVEYVSIMFEMKNEMDTTATKHKNEDFLKKLDDDRRKKGCEFAVLVSLLEADNELYNGGIVDMSYRYPKMYVIRPQFFIPLITLLVQTSKKSLEYKRQLLLAQSKEVDVTNFENSLLDFQEKFGRNYRIASEKFKTAIEEIDKSIIHLQKIKDALLGSENNLRLANDKAQDLTIKRLIRNNPTMKQKFDEVRTKGEE